MVFSYKKAEKATVVLNDLIKINNDRIACYQQALDQTTNLDLDLKNLFNEIIREGLQFKKQLVDKIIAYHGHPKDSITLSGVVHRAWVDLRVTFAGNTRNSIISFCKYNEEIAQHAYQAALNVANGMENDLHILIEEHQKAINRTYEMVKQCREASGYLYPRLMYFN